MPARPENVSGRRRAASPSRAISASPRVIERRLRVVAEAEPVDAAGGERDHVLRRGAELDADDVVVDVDAEDRRVDRAAGARAASAASSLAITAAPGRPAAISSAMFGPESTATGRSATSVESRSPVAGSRPFVRLSTGALAGQRGDDVAERAARHRDDDEVGVGDRRLVDRRGRDAAQVDVRQVARVAAGLARSRRACSGVAAGERHLVPAVAQQRARTPCPTSPPPTTTTAHATRSARSRSTRARPRGSNRSRSSFSTQ